eukprot:8665762-Alexandrium_andersonii.AAC.1
MLRAWRDARSPNDALPHPVGKSSHLNDRHATCNMPTTLQPVSTSTKDPMGPNLPAKLLEAFEA